MKAFMQIVLALYGAIPLALGAQVGVVDVVDPTPVLRIGEVMDKSDAYAFTDVGAMVVIGDSILVLERSAQEVRIFDHRGTFLGKIGRQGEGPGEFQWATDLRVVPEGLVVGDAELGRHTFFSLKGDLIRTEPLGQLATRTLARSATMRGGAVVAQTIVSMSNEEGAYPRPLIVVFHPGTDGVDTLAEYASGYVPFRAERSYGFLGVGAGSEGAWAVAGDSLLVLVSGEQPALRWWSAEGGGVALKGRIELPVPPLPFSAEDERTLVEKDNERRRERGWPLLPRSVKTEAPRYWGQIKRLVVSDRGVCWIQWDRPEDEVDQEWFRVDLKTRRLERVSLPPGFQVLAAAGRSLYGYSLTEFDIPLVTVYRLRRPEVR